MLYSEIIIKKKKKNEKILNYILKFLYFYTLMKCACDDEIFLSYVILKLYKINSNFSIVHIKI